MFTNFRNKIEDITTDAADMRTLRPSHENLYAATFNNWEWTNSLKDTTCQNGQKRIQGISIILWLLK